MSYYLNVDCPCCGKKITEDHQLVVCPECGTPHHRECYFEIGSCFNDSLHQDNFEWERPVDVIEISEQLPCPDCGKFNRRGSTYCNYCGNKLATKNYGSLPAPSTDRTQAFHGGTAQSAGVFGDIAEQLQFSADDKIDGIYVKDWIVYIGQSFNYYLYHFRTQDKYRRKPAFTVSAFLFPQYYFLYRKVWWAAFLSINLTFFLNIPLVTYLFLYPEGITFGLSQPTLLNAANICAIALFTANICWGLFAVWFFRKNAKKRIDRLQIESANELEFNMRLHRASGPSKTAVIVYVALTFAVSFIYSVFVGLSFVGLSLPALFR